MATTLPSGQAARNVTPEDLVAEVRRIAAERPDVRYQAPGPGHGCSYVSGTCTDGSVGCLFGQAMREVGIDPEPFGDTASIQRLVLGALWTDGCENDDLSLARWCQTVQDEQDRGRPWGASLRAANEQMQLKGGDA